MCGIAGIFSRGDVAPSTDRLLAMREDQTHRGPDAAGLYTGPHIGLAFNRLAIIGRFASGDQSMMAEGGAARIVFNGGVKHYRDLPRGPRGRRRRLRTRRDKEDTTREYIERG